MTSGELGIEPLAPVLELLNLEFVATSTYQLRFREPGRKPLAIMSPFDTPEAFRCTACGTVIICGLHGTDSECLACGAMMAPGVTVCPKCGWTYEVTAS